jgi:Uma2 family endonuclease
MASTNPATILTLDEFLALPEREPDGSHYELNVGELIILSPAGYRHGIIVGNVVYLLRSLLDRNRFLVVGGETGFLLDSASEGATVRAADVAVTSRAAPIPVGLFPGAPLLAIEVVSPTNTAEDLEEKIQQYLDAGSQEVWVLYPETRHVHFFSAAKAGPTILTESDTLSSSVLEIQVNLEELFSY